LNTFIVILLFLLMLTVIICLHEWGHLIAAKKFNVYCFEYSFGMGPVLFQRKKKETVYSIRALPVGGFVSMAGEPDGDAAYPDVVVPEGRRLTEQKPWKRIIIMAAGIVMNFLLAYVIFCFLLLYVGSYVESPRAEVTAVSADSPAEKAGMQAGDVITAVTYADGFTTKTKTFLDLQYAMASADGSEVVFTVERGEDTLELTVIPEYSEEAQSYLIGITGPQPEIISVNLLNCWKYGALEMHTITKTMLQAIRHIFQGAGVSQLSGPVGIYQATEQSASYGFIGYVLLVAELSLNVGLFNLLPLPVLDGGQILITLVEWIIRRPVNSKVKTGIMVAAWALLILLMITVTWNDIARLAF
jgi:regulator of sigma E protease